MTQDDLFRKLGISKTASKVYSALFSMGANKAGAVVKAVNIHRMTVYDALEELVAEGLVSVSTRNNVKIFTAAEPDQLVTKVTGLLKSTEAVVEELRRSKKSGDSEVTVRTLLGKDGFWENLQLLTMSCSRQKKRLMRIIGAGGDKEYYEAIGNRYKQYVELCARLKIDKRLLTDVNAQDEFNKKAVPGTRSELRALPQNSFSPMYTRITEDYVSIEIFKPEIVVIQIHGPLVAKSYIDSFDYIWNATQKLRPKKEV